MQSTRRDFLQTLLAMGGAAATLGALGCGDDDGPAGPDAGGGEDDAGGGEDAGGGGEDAGGGGEDAGGGGEDAGTTEDAGTSDDAGSSSGCSSVAVTIGSNHARPHTLMVPVAHVTEGTERTYDIQGDSAHPHSIVVTAADFAMLAAGMTVTVTSSRDAGHTHEVTLMCG